MITDEGAQLLLVAIYGQAKDDLEELFGKVVLYRKACERGQLDRYLASHGLPLAAEDERTAYSWYAGKVNLPKEMQEMWAVINSFEYYCQHCRTGGGKGYGAS